MPCVEKLDLPKLKRDALKYPQAGVPMEKMGFWNHIDEYFLNLAAKEEEAESWTLQSLKHKKNQVQPTPHTGSVTVPKCIGNVLRKDTEPIPEVIHLYVMLERSNIQ